MKGQIRPLTFGMAMIFFCLLLMFVNVYPFNETEKGIVLVVAFIFFASYILLTLYDILYG